MTQGVTAETATACGVPSIVVRSTSRVRPDPDPAMEMEMEQICTACPLG